MPRRNSHYIIATLLLAGGVLMTTTIDDSPPDDAATAQAPFAPPRFTVTTTRNAVTLRGMTVSAEHETALLQLTGEHFGEQETNTEFSPGVTMPAKWETISNRLLYALAATESANAVMTENSITIRGVTADTATFASRLAFLGEALEERATLTVDVVDVAATTSYDLLCRRAFSELVIGPVTFLQSSTGIRDASRVSLDRLVDYANDCPQTTIMITGHTDASGNESWNRQLSLARAQAVADHMIARGIDADRLEVEGRGSAEPIADNTTSLGRELNRRIEFELR